MISKYLCRLLTVGALSLIPGFALASSSVYPQEAAPSTTQTFHFVLDFPQDVDSIVVTQPASTGITYTHVTPAPASALSSPYQDTQWGSYASPLLVGSFDGYITATTGTTLDSSAWRITAYAWHRDPVTHAPDGSGLFDTFTITTLTARITNSPVNVTPPPEPPTSTATGDAINGSGITDIPTINGWLPPGPIDAILTLPIDLINEIISVASLTDIYANTPTISFLGYSHKLGPASDLYDVLGTGFSTALSGICSFILLYVWVKSLFHRLHRATSLQTHPDDVWGAL